MAERRASDEIPIYQLADGTWCKGVAMPEASDDASVGSLAADVYIGGAPAALREATRRVERVLSDTTPLRQDGAV